MEKFLDTPVKRYSSGMYMRLAFAVAAHLEPEILIVDEVLAVGDRAFQKKCLGKMQDVSRGGRTVLFVSHNMAAVQKLCTRALVLRAGNVALDGRPDDVVRFYLEEGIAQTGGFADLTRESVVRRGDGRVRFTHFRLLNSHQAQTGEFLFGEPLTVEIAFESSITKEDVVLGFSFITSDGVELMGTCAHDGGVKTSIEPRSYSYQCAIDPNMLVPGKYFIRAAIFLGGELYDHIDEVMLFEVAPAIASTDDTPSSHYVGHVYFGYQWTRLEQEELAARGDA